MKSKLPPRRIAIALSSLFAGAAVVAVAAYAFVTVYPEEPQLRTAGIRVAAIGDSITFGAGAFPRYLQSYPAQLQTWLGVRYQVLNYGLNGRTLLDNSDWAYRRNTFFDVTRGIDPAVVIIMLGTNDSKPAHWNPREYERELRTFVKLYQNLPSNPRVYMMTPPEAHENGYEIDPYVVEFGVVPTVWRVAQELGVPVIDVFSATKGHPEWFSDGVHPTNIGYAVIAETVRKGMTLRRAELKNITPDDTGR